MMPESSTASCAVTIDKNVIKEQSIIYTKNPNRYQKAVNDATYQLCLENPNLLLEKKGDLLEMARQRVHEDGYCYKKGHSRSRLLEPQLCSPASQPKRKKVNAEIRQKKITSISEQISDFNRQISFKA